MNESGSDTSINMQSLLMLRRISETLSAGFITLNNSIRIMTQMVTTAEMNKTNLGKMLKNLGGGAYPTSANFQNQMEQIENMFTNLEIITAAMSNNLKDTPLHKKNKDEQTDTTLSSIGTSLGGNTFGALAKGMKNAVDAFKLPLSGEGGASQEKFANAISGFKELKAGMKDAFKTSVQENPLLSPMVNAVKGFKTGRADAMAKGESGLKGGFLGGLKGGWQGITKSMGASLGPLKAMGSTMMSMGPQMAALMLVIQPVMAFLEGILAPLEPLSELLGSFGEALGLVFVPVVQQIVQTFIPFLPYVIEFALQFGKIFLVIFDTISPLGILISYIGTFTGAMDPEKWKSQLDGVWIGIWTWLSDTVPNALKTLLTNAWESIKKWWADLWDNDPSTGWW